MRTTILLIGFVLIVASCGSSGSGDASTTAAASATTATSDNKPEGSPAPDFTLALGETGAEEFTLSQEVKPVFMVFWADW